VILVDRRTGSHELVAPLRRCGLEVEEVELPFADIVFEGRGVGGAPVSIGIEFKQLRELVQAIRTERLQGYQLRGMRPLFDHSYLFIEGELLYDAKGRLIRRTGKRSTAVLPGQMSVNELLKRVQVLHLCGGLNPWWTTNRKDTLQSIVALYHTWTDTDLDKHKSHLAIYEAPPLLPISDFRRTIKTLPGIGMQMSLAAEQAFKGSLRRAFWASADEWAALVSTDEKGKTRRLGMKTAEQIVDFCRREKS
jgi:ERCC4-type nuclease